MYMFVYIDRIVSGERFRSGYVLLRFVGEIPKKPLILMAQMDGVWTGDQMDTYLQLWGLN